MPTTSRLALAVLLLALLACKKQEKTSSAECQAQIDSAKQQLASSNRGGARHHLSLARGVCPESYSAELASLDAQALEPPAPPVPTKAELLAKSKTIAAALKLVGSDFEDVVNDTDKGALLFAMWAAKAPMDWKDLESVESTTYKKVMKDPTAERQKRICARGSIVEIRVDRKIGTPIYFGGLIEGFTQVYRFIAVRDTGELVERSNARFCGVVTGLQSYSNVSGGTTHAVHLVGMFDLPENKK